MVGGRAPGLALSFFPASRLPSPCCFSSSSLSLSLFMSLSGNWVLDPSHRITLRSVTLSKLFALSEPQFLHLKNGDENTPAAGLL